MKHFFTNTLAHYGDMAAIPFFILTLYYFYQIEQKTLLETIIMCFIVAGLACDVLFTFIFLTGK